MTLTQAWVVVLLQTAIVFLGSMSPARGQSVIRGRVEDADARTPIAGARIVAPDSTVVSTDSLGVFSIVIEEDDPLFVEVDQYGYMLQRFYLPVEARSRTSVLLLEPNAIELDPIDVVAESSVERLLTSLRSRRNGYPGSVQAFDRARLDRFAGAGSVWDFVSSRARVQECDGSGGGFSLGFGGAGTMLGSPIDRELSGLCHYRGGGVLVCIDGWTSWGAVSQLSSMDIRSVALVEIFGRGRGIRVYTAGFLLNQASRGRTMYFNSASGC